MGLPTLFTKQLSDAGRQIASMPTRFVKLPGRQEIRPNGQADLTDSARRFDKKHV
jgi:hypothetical protein